MYVCIYIYIYIYIYISLFFIHISLQTGNGQTRGMRPENTEHTLTWSRNSDRTELSISFCFLSNNRMSLSSRIMVSFCVLYTVYVTQVKSKRKKKKKKEEKEKEKRKRSEIMWNHNNDRGEFSIRVCSLLSNDKVSLSYICYIVPLHLTERDIRDSKKRKSNAWRNLLLIPKEAGICTVSAQLYLAFKDALLS